MKIEFNKLKYPLFFLGLLGFIVSIDLCYIFYNANFVPNASASFCAINEIINCDAVAESSYSVLLGIPMAVYALVYYFFIMFFAICPFEKLNFFKNFKNAQSYIFLMSNIGLIGSVALWGVSTFVIHKICVLCYILYAVNIALFFISMFGKSFISHYKEAFGDFVAILSDKRWLAIFIVMAIATLTFIVFACFTRVFEPSSQRLLHFAKTHLETENKTVGNILGAKNPKLIIQEFTDYQCPYCSMSHTMLKRLVSEVDGVRVIHHDFPLNSQCNSLMKGVVHPNSCTAVYYARAAKKQGKYWDYMSLLFENQENISEATCLDFGKKLNLNIDKLKKDAHSQEVKDDLKADIDNASSLNINATPTYLIGMKKHEGLMPYPELKQTVLDSMK